MNFDFLLQRASRFLPELALISLLNLASSLALLAMPWLGARLLGGILGGAADDRQTVLVLLALAILAFTGLTIAVRIVSAHASGRILAGLRREAYSHLQAMPIAFHNASKLGDLLGLMTYEVDSLSDFLTATLASLPSMIVTACGAVVLMFLLDPALALVVPLVIPFFWIGLKLFGRPLRNLSAKVREAEVKLVTTADSDLAVLPAIKAFAVEDFHRERFEAHTEKARVLELRRARLTAVFGPLLAMLAAAAAIMIVLAAGDGAADSGQSASELFAFLLYAALLTRPVGALANSFSSFQIARGTLARLEEVLNTPVEPGYAQTAGMTRAKGAIAFENVSFSYPGRDRVLDGFDLRIDPGEVVALTGPNGAGKSTLVRLLMRYYEPRSGRITLDGCDVSRVQVQDLRRQFGYVPQRALLFNGSVRENIAFGDRDPSDDAVSRAIALARAADFIARLPEGIDTEIGDNGVRLSGGQRQRIALARALYRDPPVFIFDEATSMFDLESEAAFLEECIRTLRGRTMLLITHRSAALRLADRVLMVDGDGLHETDPGLFRSSGAGDGEGKG